MMTVPLKIGLKTWWMGIMRIIAFIDYVRPLPESPPIFVIGPVPWKKLVSIFKSTNVPAFAYHKTQQRMEMLSNFPKMFPTTEITSSMISPAPSNPSCLSILGWLGGCFGFNLKELEMVGGYSMFWQVWNQKLWKKAEQKYAYLPKPTNGSAAMYAYWALTWIGLLLEPLAVFSPSMMLKSESITPKRAFLRWMWKFIPLRPWGMS